MRARGITYDTGFIGASECSRPSFDLAQVERELQIIRDNLRCNAVRIVGGFPQRLEAAASIAVALGLEVWLSPYPLDLSHDEMLALFIDCADRAEALRRRGGTIVFVVGAEISIMNKGFLPGETLDDRLALLRDIAKFRGYLPTVRSRVNEFLAEALRSVRERFAGKVTYASVPMEGVD